MIKLFNKASKIVGTIQMKHVTIIIKLYNNIKFHLSENYGSKKELKKLDLY